MRYLQLYCCTRAPLHDAPTTNNVGTNVGTLKWPDASPPATSSVHRSKMKRQRDGFATTNRL